MSNFESAPNHHPDQERDDDKAQANKRALPPIQAMDNFRPATGADTRALRNLLMAVRAQEHVHDESIPAWMFRTNRFLLGRVRAVNANARYNAVLAAPGGGKSVGQSSGCGPPYFSVEMLGTVKTDRRHRWRKRLTPNCQKVESGRPRLPKGVLALRLVIRRSGLLLRCREI